MDVPRVPFIPPALPKLKASPPISEGWLYELKFDGYRVQLHKDGLSSMFYGRNGGDFTRRFPAIATAVIGLPIVKSEPVAALRTMRAPARPVIRSKSEARRRFARRHMR